MCGEYHSYRNLQASGDVTVETINISGCWTIIKVISSVLIYELKLVLSGVQ